MPMIKKLISAVLSLSICLGAITAANAADASLRDEVNDDSLMYSNSGNLIFEEKDKLGSYVNPAYATSGKGKMEIVYELENMASFEVVTLNYNNAENTSFYVSNTPDGEYTQIIDITRAAETLGSNWTKITYSSGVLGDEANYFKIVIDQTNAKYIRLDNVELLTRCDLELEECTFYDDDIKLEENCIYNANRMELKFNQSLSYAPSVTITADSGTSIVVDGEISGNSVSYSFERLKLDVYSVSGNDFQSLTGMQYNLDKSVGCKVIFNIPDVLYFGEKYSDKLVERVVDCDGNDLICDSINECISDESIIAQNNGILELKKPGIVNIDVEVVVNGIMAETSKQVTLCGAKEIIPSQQAILLKRGETTLLSVKVLLTDGTEVEPTDIKAESADYTIATVDGTNVNGVDKGNTFINLTVQYYGEILKMSIPVGVEKKPENAISKGELLLNRDTIVVGEEVYPVLRGEFTDGTAADMTAAVKTIYSDNETVVKAMPNGKITAVGAGNTNIYAQVTLGGADVVTAKLNITVTKDEIERAELIIPRYNMLTGDVITGEVRAYTKTGSRIENPMVAFKIFGGAVTVNDNSYTAVKSGTAKAYALVEYDGKTIETNRIELTVKDGTGSVLTDFLGKSTLEDIYSTTGSWVHDSTAGIFGAVESADAIEAVFYSADNVTKVEYKCHYHTSLNSGETKILVSKDNVNYTEIPENEVTRKNVFVEGVWYDAIFTYSGEMLDEVHYVKFVMAIDVTKDPNRAQTVQAVRLTSMELVNAGAPEVSGVSLIKEDGTFANGTDARKIIITFSRDIDINTLGGISLKNQNSGEVVKFEGMCDRNNYTISLNELSEEEYELCVSGVENPFGIGMTPYKYNILPEESDGVYVKDVFVSGNSVIAILNNKTGKDVTATVITVAYDDDGYMTNMYIDSNVAIGMGESNFLSGGVFKNAKNVKMFIWDDMQNMWIY